MKKSIILGCLYLILFNSFAKKNPEAWKSEKNLDTQFSVFKANASYWDGFFMFKEPQLNEFNNAYSDTIKKLESAISINSSQINKLNTEITSLNTKLSDTEIKLQESISKENGIVSLGISFDKNTFPSLLYSIIILLMIVAALAFFLFLRSNSITKETEKRFLDQTTTMENQKKRSLERETKLNRELQTERNKNNS